MLISRVRLYHLTVKVSTSSGTPGSQSLKGYVVYFPQDCPETAVRSLRENVAWVLGDGHFQVVLVGPEDQTDNMQMWLLGRDVNQARSHVIYNYLAVYNSLDRAMGNPDVTPQVSSMPTS